MAFSLNIKRLMQEKNVDQKALADALGVSQGTISQWLTGRTLPRGKRLDAIADFFGVATNQLLFEAKSPSCIDEKEDKILVDRALWEAKEKELEYLKTIIELQKQTQSQQQSMTNIKNSEVVLPKS